MDCEFKELKAELKEEIIDPDINVEFLSELDTGDYERAEADSTANDQKDPFEELVKTEYDHKAEVILFGNQDYTRDIINLYPLVTIEKLINVKNFEDGKEFNVEPNRYVNLDVGVWMRSKATTKIVDGKEYYCCGLCSFTTSGDGTMDNHRLIHVAQIPHRCDLCLKNFTPADGLKKHAVYEFGKKRFKCCVCEFACVASAELRTHITSHCVIGSNTCTAFSYSCMRFGYCRTVERPILKRTRKRKEKVCRQMRGKNLNRVGLRETEGKSYDQAENERQTRRKTLNGVGLREPEGKAYDQVESERQTRRKNLSRVVVIQTESKSCDRVKNDKQTQRKPLNRVVDKQTKSQPLNRMEFMRQTRSKTLNNLMVD